MRTEDHCNMLVSMKFFWRRVDCIGLRLSRRGAVGPPWRADIPTEICKLFVDSLESHFARGVCVVGCKLMKGGCEGD